MVTAELGLRSDGTARNPGDSDEEREQGLRAMSEMYEDTPYNGYWDI